MKYFIMLVVFIFAIGIYVGNMEPDIIVEEKIVEKVVQKVVEIDNALDAYSALPGYWVYPDSGSRLFTFFFSSDGSFELAGKKTTKNKVGYWVDKGAGKVKLLYNNGDEKFLDLVSETKFALGTKVYRKTQ